MIDQILSQAKKLIGFHIALYSLPFIIVGAVVLTSRKMGIPLYLYTVDTSSLGLLHPFAGILSNLGIILWCAAAAVCFFAWAAFRRNQGDREFASFLLWSGLLTTLLMLDDFFMFHESIFPDHLGINEKLVQLSYVCLILIGGWMFRKCVLATDYLIVLVALGFFGLSVVIDVFEDQVYSFTGNWRYVLEDGAKFFGIAGWFGYYFRCSILRLKPVEEAQDQEH